MKIGRWAAVGCLMVTSACSNGHPGGLFPPGQPTPRAIQQTQQEFDSMWTGFGATEAERAATFTLFGYKRASDACQTFFENARKLQDETTFAKDTLVAASAAAGIIAGLSGVTANVLTALFAGTGLVPSTVDNFNKIFLLSAVADELAGQVFAGMEDYQTKHPASATTTKEDAIRNVRANASWCSLPFMNYLVKTSVASVRTNNVPTTGEPPPPPPGVVLPVTPPRLGAAPPPRPGSSTIGRFGGIEISK
jgi:hypothetical protein